MVDQVSAGERVETRRNPPIAVESRGLVPIWHNSQVLDLRGPSLRVCILSFEPQPWPAPREQTYGFAHFQNQE